MGNGLSSDLEEVFGGWCVGEGRRDFSDEKQDQATTQPNRRTPKLYEEDDLLGPDERIRTGTGSVYSSSSSPKASLRSLDLDSEFTAYTYRTPSGSAKKSSAHLASVGLSDGRTKDRYLNHASLDDAFAQGLIDADDYAQKLRRLDSLQYSEEALVIHREETEPIPMARIDE